MQFDEREQNELMSLLVQMSDGTASEVQYRQLDEWIRTSPEACRQAAEGLLHLADLEWETRCGGLAESESRGDNELAVYLSDRLPQASTSHTSLPLRHRLQRFALFWVGLAAMLLLSFGLGWYASQESPTDGPTLAEKLPSSPSLGVATLVSNTDLMWDTQAGFAISPGAPIMAGRSVALLEGTAEIQFTDGLNARIAGPAMLATDDDGALGITYGKGLLSNAGEEELHVKVAMATVVIPSGSLIGVDAFGDEVVVQTCEGETLLIPDSMEWEPTHMVAGEGVRLRTDAYSHVSVEATETDSATFHVKASVNSDELRLPGNYRDLVMDAAPFAYWRFEEPNSRTVRNEVGPLHALTRLSDTVGIHAGATNGYAELHLRDAADGFVSVDLFDEFRQPGYSIELWMRPSHFHRGVLAALVEQTSDDAGEVERHALVFETNSANPIPAGKEGRSKAIRFLHRSPPHDLQGGTSCFAFPGYSPRVWQHLAVVKDGASMNIYLNGELAATAEDETSLTGNLKLVIGQLFSFGSVRPFVGDLDEIAMYDRALSPGEIQCHVLAVLPSATKD